MGRREAESHRPTNAVSAARCSQTYIQRAFSRGRLPFLSVQPSVSYLSDANEPLILTFLAVRDSWQLVARYLRDHASLHCKRHYYRVRREYNECSRFSCMQAARFIYLNKACFNGIFRVNMKGKFNVPYGWKKSPALPSSKILHAASEVLTKSNLCSADYQGALAGADKGDFVYLDPPYPPLNGTAYFTQYTRNRFSERPTDAFSRGKTFGSRRLFHSDDERRYARNPSLIFRVSHLESSCNEIYNVKKYRHSVNELVITNY